MQDLPEGTGLIATYYLAKYFWKTAWKWKKLDQKLGGGGQGWEAWPHAHLNEKSKSINICQTSHDQTSKCVSCISKYGYISDDTKIKFIHCGLLE